MYCFGVGLLLIISILISSQVQVKSQDKVQTSFPLNETLILHKGNDVRPELKLHQKYKRQTILSVETGVCPHYYLLKLSKWSPLFRYCSVTCTPPPPHSSQTTRQHLSVFYLQSSSLPAPTRQMDNSQTLLTSSGPCHQCNLNWF